jgi:electron transport complex protein RnfA
MQEILLIIFSTALVNNFVLVKFLGLCPFMGVSKHFSGTLGMSLATALVLTITAGLSYIVNKYILVPLDVEYLRIIIFIILIATTVQIIEFILQKISPLLYQILGIYLPLITTNCAVLGLALLTTLQPGQFHSAIFYGLGTAIGFSLVLILFSGMRERLQASDVPTIFQGAPIALITAGIMALAFMGFIGLIRVSV